MRGYIPDNNEIKMFLQSFKSNSKEHLLVICNMLENYYDWCKKEGYVNGKNPYEYDRVKDIIESITTK